MYLPLVQPISKDRIYVSGDVTIDPSVALAPGTIIQAAPHCKVIISAGACVGMGTVLNACTGAIEIESGAVLGAGVLIVGEGKVGRNACVGTVTTVFQANIAAGEIVAPGSLIGDTSRSVPELAVDEVEIEKESEIESKSEIEPEILAPATEVEQQITSPEAEIIQPEVSEIETTTNSKELEVEVEEELPQPDSDPEQQNTPIVGKVYINKLLVTLFPQGQSLNNTQVNDTS